MDAVFLSASVPVPGRGTYYQNADPFLIQFAVREFVMAALGRRRIIWGGHPAITPMIISACEDLGADYEKSVTLYQSRYFEALFPKENIRFSNIIYTEGISGDRDSSLHLMRTEMLSRKDLKLAVFIGGMEGVIEEHKMFTRLNPTGGVLPVASPGGAALELALSLKKNEKEISNMDFPQIFYTALGINISDSRYIP